MAFIPEDGTGLVNSNSLCDVLFADEYFEDRAITAWTDSASEEAKEAALIKATDYITLRFDGYFIDKRNTETQALIFPRGGANHVPEGVKRACAEYALRALTSPLLPDPVTDPSGFAVASTRRKVGPIERETKFHAEGSVQLLRRYPAADLLLRPYLKVLPGVIRG